VTARTIVVTALAIVFGISAAFGIRILMNKAPEAPSTELVPVVYAVSLLQRNDLVDEAMVKIVEVPKGQAPVGALSKIGDVLSRVVYLPVQPGQPVFDAMLAPKGSGIGMSALIKPGMRAFTITTPSLSGSLAGFLLPGNRVDVLLTIATQGGTEDELGGAATATLLQNIEILAVHTTTDTPRSSRIDPNEARSVTLQVTPEQATVLDLGQNKGTLHLSLRSMKDESEFKSKLMGMSDLKIFRDKPKPPPVVVVAPPAPPPPAPLPPVVATPPPLPPEPVEVVFLVRTLRGTTVGADRLRMRVPASAAGQLAPDGTLDPSPTPDASPLATSNKTVSTAAVSVPGR
jgi:pilus assembly protein CpaB